MEPVPQSLEVSRPTQVLVGHTGQRLASQDAVENRESNHADEVHNAWYNDAIITAHAGI